MTDGKKILWGVAALAVIVIVGVVGLSGPPPPSEQEPAGKMVLGASVSLPGSLVYIAENQGYFRDAGVNVEIKDFSAGKLAVDALDKREVDISTSSEFVMVARSFEETDLRVVASISAGNGLRIVGNIARGVTVGEDLRGKRIGVTLGSASEFYLSRFLAFHGLASQDVEMVDLGPAKIVDGMTGGNLDAAITWQPHVHVLQEKMKDQAVIFDPQQGLHYFFILVGHEDWIKANPQVVQRMLSAFVRAAEWTADHKEAAQAIVADRVGLSKEVVATMWGDFDFTVSLPQSLIVAMDTQARWALTRGIVTGETIPDFYQSIHAAPMEAVAPRAVKIFN